MMRTAELAKLAERFQIKFITIRDLQEYRKCHDKLVDQVTAVNLPAVWHLQAYGFGRPPERKRHCTGKVTLAMERIFLCRVHSGCLTGDTFWLFAL